MSRSRRPAPWLPLVVVLVAMMVQLAVGAVAGEGSRFAGKGFGARLVAYPLFVLVAPAGWWLVRGRRGGRAPWAGFALIGAPFLVDVTGNSLNLYDTVWWWDDANHFLNWFLLCSGLALVV